ncbi:glycoside hydrolase family 85 protein [Schizophyllum commune]
MDRWTVMTTPRQHRAAYSLSSQRPGAAWGTRCSSTGVSDIGDAERNSPHPVAVQRRRVRSFIPASARYTSIYCRGACITSACHIHLASYDYVRSTAILKSYTPSQEISLEISGNMPLAPSSSARVPQTHIPYFRSLEELDNWAESRPQNFQGVCHDYKGGYKEDPYDLSYTFNFWSSCDIFVYFAHHRITIPPPGWVNAAHRQGVKMLGTLIFENDGESDCLRLLVGKLPSSKTGPAAQAPTNSRASLPVSPHYARLLAQLAAQRGFDGYLLNFECPLRGGPEQTQALASWIALLRAELRVAVGEHAHVSWYDSVVINGQLRWQDRLNAFNLPFFLPADSFFTNYTWRPNGPADSASFFLSLDPAHVQSKRLRDIHVGVDVWGRGQHGGGGLACFRALEHISPRELGLSTALFGQAWTWESEQDEPGWTWAQWWARERLLWVGPLDASAPIALPEAPRREGEPECPHGHFKPVGEFFGRGLPPDPAVLPFHTTFCPGVGEAWFVEGRKVSGETRMPWTDVDKQTSLGDVWPRLRLAWEDADKGTEGLPEATADLSMEDAWNGGSSLKLELTFPPSEAEDAAYRCVWVPVQALGLSVGHTYEVVAVYKVVGEVDPSSEVEVGLAVKSAEAGVSTEPTGEEALRLGWTKLKVDVSAPTACAAEVGFVIALVAEDTSKPATVSLLLGQLNVHSKPPIGTKTSIPTILWVDYARDDSRNTGVITWEVAAALPPPTWQLPLTPEQSRPAWIPQIPSVDLLYFSIYVQYFAEGETVGSLDEAQWIGTTGLDGEGRKFEVIEEKFTAMAEGKRLARFYVRGVTDRGEVAGWDQSAYVEVAVG